MGIATPTCLPASPQHPQCCPLPDTGVLSIGFTPATPEKKVNARKKKIKCIKKNPPNFSTQCIKLPWTPSQESLYFHIMLKPELNHCPSCQVHGSRPGVPKLSLHPGLGLCQVMVYRERAEPREADEEGWRWGRQRLLVLF